MKTLLTITALAFLSTGALAGNPNCNVNWVNGACGDYGFSGGGAGWTKKVAEPVAEPDPECDPKDTKRS